MKIELKKFGELLISRPSGREAFLVFKSYFKPKNLSEPIELDFTGIKVLTPSWADEFISGIQSEFQNSIVYLPSNNSSVLESLKRVKSELQTSVFTNFIDGTILQADQLNHLYWKVADEARKRGLSLKPKITWINGTSVSAKDLNLLLQDVNSIYEHLSLTPPSWSFGKFKDGQKLKAEYLNEIIQSLKNLPSS